jgi:hypothetical protein
VKLPTSLRAELSIEFFQQAHLLLFKVRIHPVTL